MTENVELDRSGSTIYRLAKDHETLRTAAILEQEVWNEMGYGSLDEYSELIADSRTFTAHDRDRCVGVTRMFGHVTGRTQPFLLLPFDDLVLFETLADGARKGIVEELGTVAVARDRRRDGMVSASLWRIAYRDAVNRGIRYWGIIMEPQHVRAMNRIFGFTFKQAGPTVDYQGGMCAAHYLDLVEVDYSVRERRPDVWEWFVNVPLHAPTIPDTTSGRET